MKKLALLLALCITTLSLASCGKANKVDEPVETSVEDTETTEVSENTVTETSDEPNAEQQGLLQCVSDIKSFEGVLTMAIKMQIPMTAAEKQEYESLGNDASYAFHNVNMGTELAVDTTETITHYKGTLSKAGQTVAANPINCYTDETASQMYDLTYNESTGSQVWVKNADYTKSVLTIVKDILGHTTDITENNASSTRIIKGNVKSNYVLAIPCFKYINSEYFTLNIDESVDLPVKVTISTKTGYLSSLEITLDNLFAATNVEHFGSEPLKIVLKNTNSTNIAIPEEAINTSGEEMARIDDDISVYGKYFKSIYAPTLDEADDKVALDIVNSVIGHQYDALLVSKTGDTESEYTEILHKITNFLNYYSVDDLQTYMNYYRYCPADEQTAICIVAQLGIPGYDESFMQEHCIGAETSLNTVIMEYMAGEGLLTTTNEE